MAVALFSGASCGTGPSETGSTRSALAMVIAGSAAALFGIGGNWSALISSSTFAISGWDARHRE